jgi:hypothetical protein
MMTTMLQRHAAGRARILLYVVFSAGVLTVSACGGNLLSRKYEYEEDIYLDLDGSASVYVNASVPALVALRGLELDVNPRGRLDRTAVRAMYESPATHVESVTTSRRDNRRYVHLRIDVPDVSRLAAAAPFAWSTYAFERGEVVEYRQTLRASAARDVGDVGWTGGELVAIRLHLPSRVPFHNSPTRTIERGNIIAWEQPLRDRIKGEPLDIQAQMERQTILVGTLMLFGLTVLLAALTFAVVIWVVRRRGRMATASEQTV